MTVVLSTCRNTIPRKLNFNSSTPGKWNFKYVIFKWISVIDGWGISCDIAPTWMSLDFADDQSTLVPSGTSHYLSQCWPRSLSPYGVTRPEWVKFEWLLTCGSPRSNGIQPRKWRAFIVMKSTGGTVWVSIYTYHLSFLDELKQYQREAWNSNLTTHLFSIEPIDWRKLHGMCKARNTYHYQVTSTSNRLPVSVCTLCFLFIDIYSRFCYSFRKQMRD